MKKTLTANISGSVFHIEEDAYEKLQRYLATIRGNFSGSDGRDEIMGDIEGRIAELFTERLVGRQVVTVADVEHVISVMGQPEDYLGDEPGMGTGAGTDAGANAGTGAFAGPDPTRSRKRLFRDTEDRWVGGVLSGIAAYFGIDALVLRIIYILLLFIGVGWLLYIILWIVVPPAQSAADKLQMHGEPVTVDNIKRVVEEGAEHIRRGAQTVAGEAGDLGRRWSSDPSIKRGANEVSDFFVQVVHVILKAFGKLFGAVAFMLGILLAMALVFIIVGRYNFVWHGTDLGALGLEHLANAWFPDANMFGMTWLGVIFFLGAPAIGFDLRWAAPALRSEGTALVRLEHRAPLDPRHGDPRCGGRAPGERVPPKRTHQRRHRAATAPRSGAADRHGQRPLVRQRPFGLRQRPGHDPHRWRQHPLGHCGPGRATEPRQPLPPGDRAEGTCLRPQDRRGPRPSGEGPPQPAGQPADPQPHVQHPDRRQAAWTAGALHRAGARGQGRALRDHQSPHGLGHRQRDRHLGQRDDRQDLDDDQRRPQQQRNAGASARRPARTARTQAERPHTCTTARTRKASGHAPDRGTAQPLPRLEHVGAHLVQGLGRELEERSPAQRGVGTGRTTRPGDPRIDRGAVRKGVTWIRASHSATASFAAHVRSARQSCLSGDVHHGQRTGGDPAAGCMEVGARSTMDVRAALRLGQLDEREHGVERPRSLLGIRGPHLVEDLQRHHPRSFRRAHHALRRYRGRVPGADRSVVAVEGLHPAGGQLGRYGVPFGHRSIRRGLGLSLHAGHGHGALHGHARKHGIGRGPLTALFPCLRWWSRKAPRADRRTSYEVHMTPLSCGGPPCAYAISSSMSSRSVPVWPCCTALRSLG
ncbi:MAG: PspC domain-containing protein [Flavobacteriales bacterium]|nr:PspC domain-containing protein [Flavobacteriales bacterium]